MNKYPSDEVLRILESLSRGDEIIVHWRDACGFRDVPAPEEVYYTPKTSRGSFYTIVADHLIIVSEETGRGEAYEGTVIPIGIIESVEVLRKGRRKRSKKHLKTAVLSGYPLKIPLKTIVETVKIICRERPN